MSRSRIARTVMTALLGGALVLGTLAPAQASPVITSTAVTAASSAAKTTVVHSPRSTSVVAGKTVTFTVRATGRSLVYQWYVKKPGNSWYSKISGAKKSSYTLRPSSARDGARYRVVVSGARGAVTSKSAVLTVISRPRITELVGLTDSAHATTGERLTWEVRASGNALSYRWDVLRPGSRTWATVSHKKVYSVTAKSRLHGAEFRVTISNAAGTARWYVTLGVSSSPDDPYPARMYANGGTWAGRFDYSSSDATSTADGSTNVASSFFSFGYRCEIPDAIQIGVRTADGTVYTAEIPSYPPFTNCECIDGEGCFGDAGDDPWNFAVVAQVPTEKLEGATWQLTSAPTTFNPSGKGWWAISPRPSD